MLVDVTTIGARRRRVEDERLVTGRGRYAADERPAGLCHLALLRSPYPHARIDRIDAEAARAVPAVHTARTPGTARAARRRDLLRGPGARRRDRRVGSGRR